MIVHDFAFFSFAWQLQLTSVSRCRCPICMIELNAGDPVRFLPCMHVYHKDCIDDWLLKHSLTCPNCMEPVDSALLNSYEVGRTPWSFNQ